MELLDGQGGIYLGVVTELGRRVVLRIEKALAAESGGMSLRVCQGLLKGEKMDTVIQKCTELGVTGLVPFESSRCQGRLSAQQRGKKHERWRRISASACKQCLRATPMQLAMPAMYGEAISGEAGEPGGVKLLFWEEEKEHHLRDVDGLDGNRPVVLVLGPEGGLTVEEVEAARGQGFVTVSLGRRILRAETATLTAVSIVQYLSGNL